MQKSISLGIAAMIAAAAPAVVPGTGTVFAQCPEEPPLGNYDGAGQVVCPCFAPGEQAGVVLDAPPEHYPLEILRIGIAWGSVFGGNPAQVEQALHIYPAGLPDPGVPQFTLPGPQFNDGFINEFNIEPISGEKNILSGPFSVAVEFLTNSAGNQFASSVVHDGNGCQSGRNLVKASPGGWTDACALGVTGDWVMYVVYRPCVVTGIEGTFVSASSPAFITGARPNPFAGDTTVEFVLEKPGPVDVSVYDIQGRRVAVLARGTRDAGVHTVGWNGLDTGGGALPSGIYFVRLQAAGTTSVRKVVLAK